MIIVLKPKATKKQVDHIIGKVKKLGLKTMVSKGVERTIIGVIGEEDIIRIQPLEAYPGVEKVMSILKPYKLVSRVPPMEITPQADKPADNASSRLNRVTCLGVDPPRD